jgi:hypothetical protein
MVSNALALLPFTYRESTECQNDKLGLRFRMAWGRRRAGPNLPAPALPTGNFITEEEKQTTKYPFYHVFDTRAQALQATEIRNRRKNVPAPPRPSYLAE